MKRIYTGAVATAGVLLALGPAVALSDAPRTDVIQASTKSQVDYHAEAAPARPADGGATIIGGNIQISSDRGARGGAAGACDPDPRFGTHPRPDDEGCTWSEPAGARKDFISFGRHIQNDIPEENGELPFDTDVSPDGAFVPVATDTRESFNGRGGLDDAGARFIEDREVIDDEDLNLRIRATGISGYLAPQGNADNRWRRLCGTGVVEALSNNADLAPPFTAGETRAFVVQVWDADWKDPSDADGGNQDYFIIDVFRAGTTLDQSCRPPAPPPVRPPDANQPPPGPGPGPGPAAAAPPAPVQPAAAAPAAVAAAAPPAPAPALAPARAVRGVQVVRGTARLRGPRACPVRAFAVRVDGRRIRRVTFTVDGRRIAAVARPDGRGAFTVRIDPRRMRAGVHRVRARVQFQAGSGSARTLTMSFRVCARPAAQAQPKFTG